METRRNKGRSQAKADEAKKLVAQSKDDLSDFQSYSSSSENSDNDILSDSDNDFVVQGQYADDYEPERKETIKPKNKKGQDEPVQKTTLFSLLEKHSASNSKPKPKAKPTKDKNDKKDDDFGLDSILKEMNIDDDDDPRKRKSKRKPKTTSVQTPAFLKKNKDEIQNNTDDDDLDLPPPIEKVPKEEDSEKVSIETSNTVKENVSSNSVDKTTEKPSKKENGQMRSNDFALEQVTADTLELTQEEIELFQEVEINVPYDETMDLYLFNIHEENGNLYLFCKYKCKGKYWTVCIMVGQCFYSLQFLPIAGHEDDLIEEVKKVTSKAKFVIRDQKYETKRYAFDKLNIPNLTNWYCVHLNPKGDLKQIPQEGDHYSEVHGITSSLTEVFLLEKHIHGPTWIQITEVKKLGQKTTCPMFSILDINHIRVLDESQQPDDHVPPFNICSFALQNVIDSKNGPQIVIAALNIRYYWNIETFTPYQDAKNSITQKVLVCPKKNESLSSEYVRSIKPGGNVVICKHEAELLSHFIHELEKYHIDIISSFGLNSADAQLLYDKLIQHKVKNWYLFGRIKYGKPNKGRFDVLNALAGRLPVDVRVSCLEFLKSKVNDFSAIVKEQFDVDRQNVENYDISKKLSSFKDIKTLVNFTLRDSQLVIRLLQEIKVLSLTLQISKLSSCPWSRVLLGSSSPRCETLLLQNFFTENFVLPEKNILKNEPFKRESKYKGGMVLDPIRGFYDTCILVLDFNSLYPSIIREFNICFTTVDKENPDAYKSKNSKTKGILPRIMKDLLEARNEIKAERNKLKKESDTLNKDSTKYKTIQNNIGRLNIKEKAIKLLANSIYGYLAYKGSRFQSQQLAALITKQGRSILEDTVKTMQNMCGSESAVIYGDTDSVMVNSSVQDIDQANKKADELSNAITKKYRYLKLGIDYIFLKMLLVQKKKYAALVYNPPNKPILKRSGLDMVRRDWSDLTKNLSEFVIDQFMADGIEKDQAINTILTELEAVSAILRNNGQPLKKEVDENGEGEVLQSIRYPNGVPITDLLINKALKNSVDKYEVSSKNPPHVAVALKLKEKGIIKVQNDTISYYIVKSEQRDIASKAKYKDDINDFSQIDVEWYLTNQLLQPLWRLCEPFGQMQSSQIANALGCHVQGPVDNEPTEYDNNPCYQINRLTELIFRCKGCNQPIKMTTKYRDCLLCKNADCGYQNNWKEVANQLTDFVRKFIENPRLKEKDYDTPKLYCCDGYLCTYKTVQLPLSTKEPIHTNGYKIGDNELCHGSITTICTPSEIFNTLRYFKALFDKPKKDADDMSEFREYMSNVMKEFYQLHKFTSVKFSSIIRHENL